MKRIPQKDKNCHTCQHAYYEICDLKDCDEKKLRNIDYKKNKCKNWIYQEGSLRRLL